MTLPPERHDTTNVGPQDYAKKPVHPKGSTATHASLYAPNPTQASQSRQKMELNATTNEQEYKDRHKKEIDQRTEAALEEELIRAIEKKLTDRNSMRIINEKLASHPDLQKVANAIRDGLRKNLFSEVTALTRSGVQREVALQRMIDKVNNGSALAAFGNVRNIMRTLKWLFIIVIALKILSSFG